MNVYVGNIMTTISFRKSSEIDLHVCLKAASVWAFDYIIKFAIYANG